MTAHVVFISFFFPPPPLLEALIIRQVGRKKKKKRNAEKKLQLPSFLMLLCFKMLFMAASLSPQVISIAPL